MMLEPYPMQGRAPVRLSFRPERTRRTAEACTRARGPALLHLPLGPLHFPKPLAVIRGCRENALPVHAQGSAKAQSFFVLIGSSRPTAVAKWRHDWVKLITEKDLIFKGFGEMKWPQRGCRGRSRPAAGRGAHAPTQSAECGTGGSRAARTRPQRGCRGRSRPAAGRGAHAPTQSAE
jgi:hypothetical protein